MSEGAKREVECVQGNHGSRKRVLSQLLGSNRSDSSRLTLGNFLSPAASLCLRFLI